MPCYRHTDPYKGTCTFWFQVQPGTPSAGALHPGDTILGIGGTNARQLTHMQAHQLIKSAGNHLQLTLMR